MPHRQVITIDVSFATDYYELSTTEILKLLVDKQVKNLTITNVKKWKESENGN